MIRASNAILAHEPDLGIAPTRRRLTTIQSCVHASTKRDLVVNIINNHEVNILVYMYKKQQHRGAGV